MRRNDFLNFSELRCSYESDDSYIRNDYYDDTRSLREKGLIRKNLDDTTQYELKLQLTESGLDPEKLRCMSNNIILYGNLPIIGDLVDDLLTSNFGFYSFEADSDVIYSERVTF